MTKEEFQDLHATVDKLVDLAIGNNKPSLPSNLDDAAQKVEDYYDVGEERGYLSCCRGDIKGAFKAGAEWMAGQFQKIEGKLVDWYSSPEGKDYCCGVKTIDSFEVPEGFYIRKK